MNTFAKIAAVAATGLVLLGAPAYAEQKSAIPSRPTNAGLVVDFDNVLSPEQKGRLEHELRALDRATRIEFTVVTVTSLNDMPISDFSRELGNSWHVGKSGEHNGVLFLISPSDHRERIEVGKRLEPFLTDAMSKDILLNHYHPHAVQKDVPGAVMDTANAVDVFLRKHVSAGDLKEIQSHHVQPKKHIPGIVWLAVFVLVGGIVLWLIFGRRKEGKDFEDSIAPDNAVRQEDSSRESYSEPSSNDGLATGLLAGAVLASSRSEDREPDSEESESLKSDDDKDDDSSALSASSDDSDDDDKGGVDLGGDDEDFQGGGADGTD